MCRYGDNKLCNFHFIKIETRTKNVDSYLNVGEQLQKSDAQIQIDFYSKIGLRNLQIEENAKKDELAMEEYVKVIIIIHMPDQESIL